MKIYDKICKIIDDAKIHGDKDTDVYAGAVMDAFKNDRIILRFGDDTDGITMGAVLDNLSGWTLKLEYTEPNSEGFPEDCSIVEGERDNLVICDVDDIGKPLTYSKYAVPYERIVSITVV